MPNSNAQFDAWSAAHPYDTGWPAGSAAPASWSQKCVSFVHRAGGFGATLGSAALVYKYVRAHHAADFHTPAQLARNAVPPGWFVYFSLRSTPDGHIGKSTGGGNFDSATAWVAGAIKRGVLGIAEYEKLAGATYLGASPYFLDQTLTTSGISLAGTGETIMALTSDEITAIANAVWAHDLTDNTGKKLASANAFVRDTRNVVGGLTAPKATVDPTSITAALKDPTVLAAIAKAVNDDAAKRLTA